jgi:hypothetical protein
LCYINLLSCACREEAGGNRFLLVGNEPCTNTLQLADIAKKLFPQYKMDTRPQYPPMVMSMLQVRTATRADIYERGLNPGFSLPTVRIGQKYFTHVTTFH